MDASNTALEELANWHETESLLAMAGSNIKFHTAAAATIQAAVGNLPALLAERDALLDLIDLARLRDAALSARLEPVPALLAERDALAAKVARLQAALHEARMNMIASQGQAAELLEHVERLRETLTAADDVLRSYACYGGCGAPCMRTPEQCRQDCGKEAGDALVKVIAALKETAR